MAVGRISGPLLKDNLLRNGVNLSFETNLLYLDVVDSRIGINTTAPQYDLDVNGTTRSTNLYATTQAQIGVTGSKFTISGNTISSDNSTINLVPNGSNPTVFSALTNIGNLSLTGNTLSSTNTNGPINITANGTGSINLNNNVLVTGNLHATGNITAEGNIILGNSPTDTIALDGEIVSNIIPNATNTYTLGSNSLAWQNVYTNTLTTTTVNATTANATTLNTSGLTITGNTVSTINANDNINFVTSGTGAVQVGNLAFSGNTITNVATNAITTFTNVTSENPTFVGTISPGTSSTFTGSISGNVLTVTSPPANSFGGSIAFNGTNEYLSLSPGFGVGGIAYTIEFFFYTTSTGTQTILGAVAGGYTLTFIGTNEVQIALQGVSSYTYAVSFSTNTWNHIAIVRNSGLLETVYINGVQTSSGARTNSINYGGSTESIGATIDGNNLFQGEISNLRVVIGTAEYDPTLTTLSVPGGQLTAVTGTAILLLAINSSNYLRDISTNQILSQGSSGTVSYSNTSPFGASGIGLDVGQIISGTSITNGTYIVSNISGTGTSASSSWTLSISYGSVISSESITSTPVVLTVSSMTYGSITIGNTISGTGVSIGTVITSQLTGSSGLAGTYYVSPIQTVSTPTTISQLTGSGYVQFTGTYGVVIPVGNTTNYPALQYTAPGMIRYNNDPTYSYVEIYNGTSWISVAGAAAGVTSTQATDIAIGVILSLG